MKKELKILYNKSGGTASSNGMTNRITIPTTIIKDMGFTIDDRNAILEYDEESKTIKLYKKG